jgi:hypothetical protein
MAAVTLTALQHFNIPTTIDSGTAEKRYVEVMVEATSAATSDTLNLATYVPGLAGIVGLTYVTLDGAHVDKAATANTWSGTTVTFAGHSGSGVWKLGVRAHN